MRYYLSKLNIDNTGTKDVTLPIQRVINKMLEGDSLVISKGKYLVSSIFLKSNTEIYFEDESYLIGTTDEGMYPMVESRIAGIEMNWYPAILNCINCENVTISGNGTIDGNGPYWWEKYWGKDMQSGMRAEYDSKGLRFACDYDCLRPRNILIQDSKNITLQNVISFRSGFWNVHVLYSKYVRIDGIFVAGSEDWAPSTDGIDIDSCEDCIVENCRLSCNDDSICIKSGRDSDGIRVNRPCHNIEVRNCSIFNGFGVTIGSEVSGGVYNVNLHDLKFDGTDCGIRIKSSIARKGYVKDIEANNLEMTNVKYLFQWQLNWNPDYSICKMPEDFEGEMPNHYKVLCEETTGKNTEVSNIRISNVKSSYKEGYEDISRCFNIEGFEDSKIHDVVFTNIDAKCKEYGVLKNTEDFTFNDCNIEYSEENNSMHDDYDNR